MKADVTALPLVYGDAEFSFFNIYFNADDENATTWHKHSYYEIHVCRNTTAIYSFTDKRVTICDGQILIIPPNTEHVSIDRRVYSEKDIIVLSFELKRIKGDKRFFSVLTNALNDNATVPLAIKHIARLNLELLSDNNSYRTVKGMCRLKSIATQLIVFLVDAIVSEEKDAICEEKDTDILIETMINHSAVTLDDIAKATNYSKRHVSRLIKSKYGVSLGELKKKLQNEMRGV